MSYDADLAPRLPTATIGGCVNFLSMNNDPVDRIEGVPATGSLWVVLPKLVIGIVETTFLIVVAFWLYFGFVDSYAFLIAAIFALLQILILIGLRFQSRTDLHARTVSAGRFDRLGAFWLMAVIFGSVVGWFTADAARAYPQAASAFQILTVLLTILVPISASIPNYRYVTAANAYITLPLLAILSALPSIIGIGSALSLWQQFNHYIDR